MAYKVVAKNFQLYPELSGVDDFNIKREIVKRTRKDLPITSVARNIDFEFYWQEKCEKEDEKNDGKKEKDKSKLDDLSFTKISKHESGYHNNRDFLALEFSHRQ